MTITLPDELKAELERKSRAAGFQTVAEYITDLVQGDSTALSFQPPPGAGYVVRSREELEAKLLDGVNQEGDVTAEADFWMKRQQAHQARSSNGQAECGQAE